MEKIISAKLVRETEKAVLLNVSFGDEFQKDVWFPRSQIKLDEGCWFASTGILEAKERDNLTAATAGAHSS